MAQVEQVLDDIAAASQAPADEEFLYQEDEWIGLGYDAPYYEIDDPLRDLLSAAAYGIRATVHGTTLFTPGQLVFSKDMILRTHIDADYEFIRRRREAAAIKNNERENKRRIPYKYQVGGKVLFLNRYNDPKLKLRAGPFKIVGVNRDNGTLHIQRGQYIESINMRLVRPYFGK